MMIKHGSGGWLASHHTERYDVGVNARKIYCKSKQLNKHHCYQQRSELTREFPINLLAYVSFCSSTLGSSCQKFSML